MLVRYLRKREYHREIRQLFLDFEKAYDSITGRFCIIFSFRLVRILMKINNFINMSSNEAYS